MSAARPKVAFFDFASCEGCQLTVVDALQTHPDLLDAVEIVQFREAMSEKQEDYVVAFVEGACTRPGDEARLNTIRKQAALVVALGACAHLGGVNAVRNRQPADDVKRYVYGESGKLDESYPARPIGAVIPVDAFIPGCPIDREEFVRAVTALLQGRQPFIPDYAVCVECKLSENHCVLLCGQMCLGSVVRAGCGAICPAVGVGCEGCRGLISHPNLESLQAELLRRGYSDVQVSKKVGLFLTAAMMEREGTGNGKG
jgi:sulfhydrogenase subunit delta